MRFSDMIRNCLLINKYVLMCIALSLSAACQNTERLPKKVVHYSRQQDPTTSLLSKFKDLQLKSLEVNSPDESDSAFGGVAIDSLEGALFPSDVNRYDPTDYPNLFACYKFNIDKTQLGLIVRTPSEYTSSSIKLFIYNITSKKIGKYIELAESWGDAGDAVTKTSWLIRDKNRLKALVWEQYSHDNQVEDLKDTTVERTNYYSLIAISKSLDTLTKDSAELLNRYSKFLTPVR